MNNTPIGWAKLSSTTIIAQGGVVGITAAIDGARADIAELHRVILHMQKALLPFSNITPSRLFPPDGSEKEEYQVFLCNNAASSCYNFNGEHLANARAAMKMAADVLAEK